MSRDGNDPPAPPDMSAAMEPFIATCIGLLAAMTDLGTLCTTPDSRDNIIRLLNSAHVWGRSACTAVRQSRVYPALMFYERIRLNMVYSLFFLDGLPAAVPVFGASVAFQFPQERMRELAYTDVLAERLHTIGKLEGMAPNSDKRKKLADSFDKLEDVSIDVPMPCRIFLSRVRSMCHGMRGVRAPNWFKQCANEECGRLFMSDRDDAEEWVGAAIPGSGGSTAQSDACYWNHIHPLPNYEPCRLRFCSRTCSSQWGTQYDRLVGQIKIKETEVPPKKLGDRTAVGVALKLAIDRNTKLRGAIHKASKRKKKCKAVSRVDFNREVMARVTRANVDTGVLYAASRIAAQPQLAGSRRLPGMDANWREMSGHGIFAKKACRIYDSGLSEASPIDNLLNPPGYLRALKGEAVAMFVRC